MEASGAEREVRGNSGKHETCITHYVGDLAERLDRIYCRLAPDRDRTRYRRPTAGTGLRPCWSRSSRRDELPHGSREK